MNAGKPRGKSYVCIHVFERTKPVLLVSRPNGSWCFLCGELHDQDASEYKVVGAEHILQHDPTLNDLPLLDVEEEAKREGLGAKWLKTSINPDDD